MKILLVSAPLAEAYRRYYFATPHIPRYPPLSLGYLAAGLENGGIDVSIMDLNICEGGLDVFPDLLSSSVPDIIGISSITASYPAGLELARISKEIAPDVVTIMGGCHVTFMAEEALTENPQVDIVVRGEGENTLRELVCAAQIAQLPHGVLGASFRQDGDIVHNPPRPFIDDLDSLPWPSRHLINMDEYTNSKALISSRGCPGRCIFCAVPAMGGHRYRHRKPSRVVDEMIYLNKEFGPGPIAIHDDTFTAAPRRLAIPICREIKRRGLELEWMCASRVDVATPELLYLMREAGCTAINFGVESGSPRVLATLKKSITLEQVRRAVEAAVQLGMIVDCSFILGHPEEREEDARMTFAFMKELKQLGGNLMCIGFLIPFPGTEVYSRRETYGITIRDSNWSKFVMANPIINTRYLGREKLIELWFELLSQDADLKAERALMHLF